MARTDLAVANHPLEVIRFPFDHTMHAALAAGVLVATLADGDTLPGYATCISIVTAFDGSGTPAVFLTGSQADAVAGTNYLASGFVSSSNPQLGATNLYYAFSYLGNLMVVGGASEVWFALTDNAGGDPGSTVGAGVLVLVVVHAP
jgi:hypothetical protein